MTDRPILMSAPMVRALLDGRKTQTRRLAWRNGTQGCDHDWCPEYKPTIWQKVKVGDRLWVRETWRIDPDSSAPVWRASTLPTFANMHRWRPSIHMPRWASRITLVVTETRMERFHEISEEDAKASGFEPGQLDDGMDERPIPGTDLTISSPGTFCSAAGMAQIFYHDMHPDPLWDAYSSPECVALTFTVHQCNIDEMEAAA